MGQLAQYLSEAGDLFVPDGQGNWKLREAE
jgi:hypothetical protein